MDCSAAVDRAEIVIANKPREGKSGREQSRVALEDRMPGACEGDPRAGRCMDSAVGVQTLGGIKRRRSRIAGAFQKDARARWDLVRS